MVPERVLQELRQLIRSTVPEVKERVSYGTTVIFALERDLVGFVAQPKHFVLLHDEPRACSDYEG